MYNEPVMEFQKRECKLYFCLRINVININGQRYTSKISEKLGRCGRQNMLWPYLKIWEPEWIFGRAVKAISSLSVRVRECNQCNDGKLSGNGIYFYHFLLLTTKRFLGRLQFLLFVVFICQSWKFSFNF